MSLVVDPTLSTSNISISNSSNSSAGNASAFEYEHCSRNYEAWGASGSKYKARIVIFCILAAVDRFLGFLKKRKAIEDNQKDVEERRKAIEESGKLLKKAESC